MRRIIRLGAALALATSPFALSAQEAAPQAISTGSGASINAPEGWSHQQNDGIIVFAAPEGDANAAVMGVGAAKDGNEAIGKAWKRFDPGFTRPINIAQDPPARDGWDQITVANYETSPAEKLVLQAIALRKGDTWTVVLIRGALATIAKRGAQLGTAFQSLRPDGFAKETFAGKTAHELTPERIEMLRAFVEQAMKDLSVPGVGMALIDNDRIVFEGGLGVKAIGSSDPVDADTRFMIASSTKSMSTLLLASLADEGKLDWDQKVVDLYPDFKLGSADTTQKVLVRHLVCACTGLPRKDMEMLLATSRATPANNTFTLLTATEPTSGFGEVFQYNNLMASAAGYLGGHLLYPDMELGAAYDRAMKERIFNPLGMTATTFDYDEAMQSNWARPHSRALGEAVLPVEMNWNDMVRPYRPAGGAWSSAHDMALYALNELREGRLSDGKQLVTRANLLKRRERNVSIGEGKWYGMGLMEDASKDVSVFFHGGTLLGYQSNFWFIPEAGVAAVVLTNADEGAALLRPFQRRLMEILYDGAPEAAENVAATVKLGAQARAKGREGIVEAGDPKVLNKLAASYRNDSLGPMTITRDGDIYWANFTTGRSALGTMQNKDGTHSLILTSPGLAGFGLLLGEAGGKRTLTLNDSQHLYVFTEESAH